MPSTKRHYQNHHAMLHVLMQDLLAAGVTDVVGEAPFSWPEEAVPQKLAVEAPSPVSAQAPVVAPVADAIQVNRAAVEARSSAPQPATSQPSKNWVWVYGEQSESSKSSLLILTAAPFASPREVHPMNEEEAFLLSRMLKAIGLEDAALTFMCVANTDPQGNRVTSKMIQALQPFYKAALQEHMEKAHHTLVLGQVAWSVLEGTEVALSTAREVAHKPETRLEGKPVGVTYHPRVLLKQPLLKRLAWQDLLAFKAQGH